MRKIIVVLMFIVSLSGCSNIRWGCDKEQLDPYPTYDSAKEDMPYKENPCPQIQISF
jgi:uncharacterized protein YceK